MAQVLRKLSRAAYKKRSLRVAVLTLAGRIHEAVWSYDEHVERRANAALWRLIGVLLAVIIISQLAIHYNVHVSIFGE